MSRAAADAAVRTEARRFYEDSFATLLATSPEVAAEIGVAQIDGRAIPQDGFSDVSPAGEQHRRGLMADALARLARLPKAPDSDELDREVYEFFLRWGRFGRLLGTESHAFQLSDSVADHLCGVQTELITCLTQWQPLETSAHAQCFISRLEAVPQQIDALIEALRERAAVGNVMPACIVGRVVEELAQLLALPLDQQPVYRRSVERAAVTDPARIARIVEQTFLPAFRRLHDLLVRDYPHEDRIGLCRLRDGEGFYRFLLKAHTTTDRSIADVHALGLQELQRLQQATSTKLRAAGYRGESFSDLFAAFDVTSAFVRSATGRAGMTCCKAWRRSSARRRRMSCRCSASDPQRRSPCAQFPKYRRPTGT